MSESMLTSEVAANTSEGAATSQSVDTQAGADAQAQGVDNTQQATEGQNSAEAAKADDAAGSESDESKPAEKQGAPEKYEFKAPEGNEFDPDVIGAFSEVAKELDLPQEAAQKVIDKIAPVLAQKQERAMAQAREMWAGEAKSDKEFGGEKLAENLATAKKALDAFATPELRTLLEQSGLGNHPEIIRAFYRAGKAISEDKFVGGSRGGQPATRDAANALYPSQQS